MTRNNTLRIPKMSKKQDLEYTIGKYELQNTMSIAMSNILLKKEVFQKYDDIAT